MDRETFEEIVRAALDSLPEEFAQHLENVAVIVEDEPEAALLRSLGMRPGRDTLLGLYHGVPLPERGTTFGNALPDRISLYYRPLLRACRTPEQLRREIRRTVIHEIGHFFGLDESELRKLGY